MLAELIQVLIAAGTAGSMYAMVAVGVTLIYSATGIINFAQGEFVMLSGMTMVSLYGQQHWPLALAIAVALAVVVLYGAVLMAITTRFGHGASLISVLIITIGTSIATSGIAARVWGTDTHRFEPFSGDTPLWLLGASVTPQALWIMGVVCISIVLVEWFMRQTLLGRAMRACASDRQAAMLMGIPVRNTVLLSFILAGLLGGIGGIVATPLTTIDYNGGMLLAIKGFSAAMLGGMGNVTGAVLGALLIALLEAASVSYGSSALKELSTFTIIILVLLLLPHGLLGGRAEIGLQHEDHTAV